jgi:hypothetical protein
VTAFILVIVFVALAMVTFKVSLWSFFCNVIDWMLGESYFTISFVNKSSIPVSDQKECFVICQLISHFVQKCAHKARGGGSDQAILGGSTIEEMWERRTSVLGSEARDSTLDRTVSALSEGLWRRAAMAGAHMAMERKAFGIADDM